MIISKELQIILKDLEQLLEKQEIKVEDLKKELDSVKSGEVNNYLTGLSEGSKPEQILREIFFSFNAKFSQYLFRNIFPEVTQVGGFIDYLIKDNREEISVEIKPLYIASYKKVESGRVLLKLKKRKLVPEEHKTQVKKYLQDKRDYVVLTNLEEWYFFSKASLLKEDCEPFGHKKLFDLLEDFRQVDDFWQYLDNQEDLVVKEPLDESFFNSLKSWVSQLGSVKFKLEDNTKTELIINLVNKFIFIQSLDSFWVISKNYIEKEWENIERKWTAKNRQRILKKYLEDINEYFYELYDTELFKIAESNKTILDYINQEVSNIELFYEKLKLVLGINYAKSPSAYIPGIIQYNFRRIDEDILGKSYETFLAEIRKEQGIYYTPKYITQYITNNTIGKYFSNIIDTFTLSLQTNDYQTCLDLIKEIFLFKVIDPACGSGSFLIKALRIIFKNYNALNEIIEKAYSKYSNFRGKIKRTDEIEQYFQQILQIKNLLNFDDKRKLISTIIIRHIHGVDLDANALEVAKLNLWLEAIKLAPKEFQFDKVPADTNHILPDLEMNLNNGDSLVSLPDNNVKNHILKRYIDELKHLCQLRENYIENPAKIEFVKEIVKIKDKIREELDKSFLQYLDDINVASKLLNKTRPFYWPLDFWFVYFNESCDTLSPDNTGFSSVIGNPPYFTIRGKGTGTLVQTYSYAYLQNALDWKHYFRSQSDIYYYFIVKSINLLKKNGLFGFIIESYWLENDYADRLKQYMLDNISINILINFGRVKKIFEDADNDTCILIFERLVKEVNKIKYIFCKNNFTIGTQQQNNLRLVSHIIENIEKESFQDDYIDIFRINQKTLGVSKWVLSSNAQLLEKIELDKVLLGDLCEIGQGVVPGRKKEFKISSEENRSTAGGYWTAIGEKYIEVINQKNNTEHRLEVQFLQPLITNSGIQRYFTIPSSDYLIYTVPLQDGRETIDDYPGVLGYLDVYKEELKDRYDFIEDTDEDKEQKYPWFGYQRIQNIEIFENSTVKILCPYRAPENRFALDEKGYYGTTDMYAIVPKEDSSVDINYLLGLLNSKLLTFWYKEAGKSKGLILEFFATPLSKMPVAISEGKKQEKISILTSEILELFKLRSKFRVLWTELSHKYRNGTISLKKLVFDNKVKIQNGEFEKVWISDINKYPNNGEEGEINKSFQRFLITGTEDHKLQIFGIEGSRKLLLLDIETTLPEFRDIIYIEILDLLTSRRVIKSLKDILSKTVISTIKPNIWQKTPNLLRYTKAKFMKWKTKSQFIIKGDNILLINNKIQEIEIELNALIFKVYNITKNEAEIILNSLGTLKDEKNMILDQLA